MNVTSSDSEVWGILSRRLWICKRFSIQNFRKGISLELTVVK